MNHQITKTEKDFLAKNIINRVVNVSQNVEITVPGSGTLTAITIDLSSVNINVSHILFKNTTGITASKAELILGNDRTGNIPVLCLDSRLNAELFSLVTANTTDFVYIIKTADSAFSTAGIPFSRLNNKKLILFITRFRTLLT